MNDLFFILGADDPEMQAIEEILSHLNLTYAYATCDWHRTSARKAYNQNLGMVVVNNYKKPFKSRIVTVECGSPFNMNVYHKIDHHYPGDPGYDCDHLDFWNGSSIGQLVKFLVSEGYDEKMLLGIPSDDPYIVAANDHCPAHAAQGLIPQVDIQAFLDYRLKRASLRTGESPQSIMQRICLTMEELQKRPLYSIEGTLICRVERSQQILYFNDASMALGLAVEWGVGHGKEVLKRGISNCLNPKAVETWMQNNELVLHSIYGSPKRGYAAGTVRDSFVN